MTLEEFKKRAKKMPDEPGVYFFLGPRKEVLYIGKATSLRDRVRSYFAPDLAETRGPIIVSMIEKAKYLEWRVTDSVLEALILEGSLIRAYKPPANTDRKDDKSYNHVVITKEDYPRVLVVRGKELAGYDPKRSKEVYLPSIKETVHLRYVFGPFPHGLQLQEAMKLIRKIFPYRDRCIPAEVSLAKGKKPKACFNSHLGLCPGTCTGKIGKAEYHRTTRHIALLFQGKKKLILKELEHDMRAAAKLELFEKAQRYRQQLFALQHINDVALIKDEFRHPVSPLGTYRIEAYDIAHLGGSAAVGVMTVVEDGAAQKSEYRKFRIRAAKAGDDPGALQEVLSRRLGHEEWPLPRLIAVDGATAQINAAQRLLNDLGLRIPVVGVVKDEKHRPREIRGDRAHFANRERNRERDILLANAEAHRFAIGYHRKRSRRDMGL